MTDTPNTGTEEARRPCPLCRGTRRVVRPKTADHILTDSEAWAWCPRCGPPFEELEEPPATMN